MDPAMMNAMGEAVDQVGIASGADQGGTGTEASARGRPSGQAPHVRDYGEVLVAALAEDRADELVAALQQAGVPVDQVGLAARAGAVMRRTGLLGATSGAEDDLADALARLGVPADPARQYEQLYAAGQTIVAVRAEGRAKPLLRLVRSTLGVKSPASRRQRPVR
jgi:crotonobetainyl-CoA:carnitine CoA-transferase CaiB-like acyl-CoA transferase